MKQNYKLIFALGFSLAAFSVTGSARAQEPSPSPSPSDSPSPDPTTTASPSPSPTTSRLRCCGHTYRVQSCNEAAWPNNNVVVYQISPPLKQYYSSGWQPSDVVFDREVTVKPLSESCDGTLRNRNDYNDEDGKPNDARKYGTYNCLNNTAQDFKVWKAEANSGSVNDGPNAYADCLAEWDQVILDPW